MPPPFMHVAANYPLQRREAVQPCSRCAACSIRQSGCAAHLDLCRFFQVPRKLLERLAAERLGPQGEEDELADFEEDDGELVFDDVGPEASAAWMRTALPHPLPAA